MLTNLCVISLTPKYINCLDIKQPGTVVTLNNKFRQVIQQWTNPGQLISSVHNVKGHQSAGQGGEMESSPL